MSPAEIMRRLKIGVMEGPAGYREGAPGLLMIHGAGGRAQMWQAQIRPLGKEINTLAIDLPGHGETPGPGRDTIASYAAWIRDSLLHMDMKPLFLMGHSMGGAIVQEAALLFPELLSGIILASTGPRLPVAPQILEGLRNRFEETVEIIIRYAYAPGADPVLTGQGAQLMKEAGPSVVHDDFLACDRFDRKNELSRIGLPCLIMCGEQDKLAPPSFSQELKKAIPGARSVLVPSAGHMVMIENYRLFNKAVHDFVMAPA
jgi:pimeloyl-ACP methyl ester carboxylesterase